ncbi:arylamine N-acetyltransferase [Nocardioides sp. SR21]|uniref:arylamine N-acetyltransferase family protein n=1 Tax=Nocardioides sp. SR21 TaxID=2919501 RepID=UPI001FA9C4BB|nr:arylamine N-acetyltransferase [Nocardioides sp. SR21]
MSAAYLSRLGIDVPPPPTLDALFLIHQRHLERVPYENLAIMLGRPPSVDPEASLLRIEEVGRAGYCFHQNGSLELVLRDLGFDVTRRHGHVWTEEWDRAGTFLNHLVLHVAGLPSPENPGGEWWVDVGLGDAFRDPVPVVVGEYRQGPFTYVVDEVREDGWSFRHDVSGSFTGVAVSTLPTEPADVLASHAELSAPGTGVFAKVLVVQRRHASGCTTLRGCVLTQVDAGGRTQTDLDTWETWRAALGDLHLPLGDVDEAELRELYARMWEAHLAWKAETRV